MSAADTVAEWLPTLVEACERIYSLGLEDGLSGGLSAIHAYKRASTVLRPVLDELCEGLELGDFTAALAGGRSA